MPLRLPRIHLTRRRVITSAVVLVLIVMLMVAAILRLVDVRKELSG